MMMPISELQPRRGLVIHPGLLFLEVDQKDLAQSTWGHFSCSSTTASPVLQVIYKEPINCAELVPKSTTTIADKPEPRGA